mgnify:CR=1 FL=1
MGILGWLTGINSINWVRWALELVEKTTQSVCGITASERPASPR